MFLSTRCNPTQRQSSLQLTVRLCWSALLWLSLTLLASAQTPSALLGDKVAALVDSNTSAAVGRVSFLIGQAHVTRNSASVSITPGMPLLVGDRLSTSANGHVHVRFVDGALVSLRPTSTLYIKEYSFDAQTPSNSEVRFELEQGVVRAISGQAAESAKDKFRLNTPLAAIGVKGTDFVVEASRSRVNAIVNQGSIVLAPFDSQCLASALGPCSTQFAKELTAALKGMALTYNMSMPAPQLLPMGQLKGSELLNMSLPLGGISQAGPLPGQSSGSGASSSVQNNTANSTVAGNSIGPEGAVNSVAGGSAGNSGNGVNGSNSGSLSANRVQQNQVDGQAYSTANQILNRSANDAPLLWGRWGSAFTQDNLTLTFQAAMQNRAVTVGDGYFFLFRQESNASNLLAFQQGNVNFALQNSYAYFLDLGNNLTNASVSSGTLGVNFSTLDVKTTLNLNAQTNANSLLSSPSALPQTLSATAKLNPNTGIFLYTPSTSAQSTSGSGSTLAPPTLAGALSLDTKQAGYLFSLPTALGNFKGATLWAR